MRKVGIIGNGTDKFTVNGAQRACDLIRELLTKQPDTILVSGRSPMGGVDVWAEEMAEDHGVRRLIFMPSVPRWHDGYKLRNIEIAEASDELHVIVADSYPPEYQGQKFVTCYHCIKDRTLMKSDGSWHVKSGACWTAQQFALRHPGQKAVWHVVSNGP